jgi:hypothetical protein
LRFEGQQITVPASLSRDQRKRLVAQRSALPDYGSEGRGFESLPPRFQQRTQSGFWHGLADETLTTSSLARMRRISSPTGRRERGWGEEPT